MNNEQYIFNPAYKLFNDKKRIIISEHPLNETIDPLAKDSFTSMIHPLYALALLYFDGKTNFEQSIKAISENLKLNPVNTPWLYALDFAKNTRNNR